MKNSVATVKSGHSVAKPPASVAVLLVAGIGQRLYPLTEKCPKALVSLGGQSIVERSIKMLVDHGVTDLVLATGFEQHAVMRLVDGLIETLDMQKSVNNLCGYRKLTVQYCYNADFRTTQNVVSLAVCEAAVAGRDFYKLDGDLLFDIEVLRRLDASEADLAVAVDFDAQLGHEEMKVRLGSGNRIEAFGKDLEPRECYGESIGVERISGAAVGRIFHALVSAVQQGRIGLYYEDIYSEVIQKRYNGGEPLWAQAAGVSDLPWIEVDTLQDLKRAEQLIASGRL